MHIHNHTQKGFSTHVFLFLFVNQRNLFKYSTRRVEGRETEFFRKGEMTPISRVSSTSCTCPVWAGLGSLFMQTAFSAGCSPRRTCRAEGLCQLQSRGLAFALWVMLWGCGMRSSWLCPAVFCSCSLPSRAPVSVGLHLRLAVTSSWGNAGHPQIIVVLLAVSLGLSPCLGTCTQTCTYA